jgi:glycosyltransferase involved in cell wall biosynthesis
VNEKNIGLASSSNIALKQARGRYIMRIDADDTLENYAAHFLLTKAKQKKLEAIYPSYYDGSYDDLGDPKTHHHVGCALFDTRAMRHFQFTEKLRGYEGLDFFNRAKDTLKIGYYSTPLWYYTHRNNSMSRTESPERRAIKAKLDAGITGDALNG